MQKKQWDIAPANDSAATLAHKLGVSDLLAQVLLNRGLDNPDAASIFLKPKLCELIKPEYMPGIDRAVDRIKKAIDNSQKITIYGDYDVDGTTGVAILWQLLTLLGADVEYYIPHRIDEGYGLNIEAVESIAKNQTSLIITVDCGIGDVKSAQRARELGVQMIITDHHKPGPLLPKVEAIVHPSLDESYLNPDSAGAMVAYKLAWAIADRYSGGARLTPQLRDFMINATTLASMGTIADVVDLRGENRILTSFGLKSLPKSSLCGIQALIETAGLVGQGLDSYHIGFRLAPMINAAGRMGHARLAVELLTSDNQIRSLKIAEYLKQQNEQRRQCERKIFKQACEIINSRGLNHPDRKTIVVAGDNWHTGVVGIVASRIVDKYYRPTIVINASAGIAQGSARSIEGFNIFTAIDACSKHLTTFGGHKMAAGLKLDPDKIDAFAKDFEAHADQFLPDQNPVKKLKIDALADIDQLSFKTVTELQLLEPFGQGNPRPVFATKGVRLASPPRRVGAKGDHLQLAITDNKTSVRCIGFNMGKFEKKLLENQFFNVAYEPQINNFNGSSTVQLVLNDLQFE